MEYKGKHIEDVKYITIEEDPIFEYDSNYVDFDLQDLENLAEHYKKKEKELKELGIDFKNLRIVFWAQDYDYNSNGPDEYEQAKIYFSYERKEAETETKKRILNEKELIDFKIEEEKHLAEAKACIKQYEIEKAIKLLEEHGYKIF